MAIHDTLYVNENKYGFTQIIYGHEVIKDGGDHNYSLLLL